jgi:hypothetical protein
MFADLAEPLPERDPYYREPIRLSMRRLLVQVRRWSLIVLPVVLVGISFYCVTEYATRFAQSVEIASDLSRQDLNSEQIGARSTGLPRPADPGVINAPPAVQVQPFDQSPLGLARLRRHVLETMGIDEVPLFAELTMLYIGVFVSALTALIVMGLKEYAMVAMGVSEEDLVLGPESSDGE